MKKNYLVNIFAILALSIFMNSVSAQSTAKPALSPVNGIDIERYAGRWYEIAKYPNRFQKQCVANTTANYTLKKNGRIEVLNECVKKDGTTVKAVGEAKIGDKSNNAKLKVRFAPGFTSFLPFVWANYWVIDIAPDYSYSVIGEPGRDYFWILSRSPEMNTATYQTILRRAETMGFDPNRVEKTPQNAEIVKGSVQIKN
ncbi:MAG TPA: lipocalin family protein [Pyrinomonadaceae bacterium]|nr:lipocalin family protein [Pyrinomonadaceae bacterium]